MKITDILPEVCRNLLNRPKAPEMPTGLRDLDDILWGLKRTELTVIAGRTSQGKSMFASFIAWNLAFRHNKKVAFFSLEMSKESFVERIISMNMEINNEYLERGMMSEKEKEKVLIFSQALENIHFDICDDWGFSFVDIENYIQVATPHIIFIDYIQMVTTPRGISEREAYAEYTRKLKEVAKKYNIACVLLSQANREAGSEMPRLEHMKSSGVLEENPDCVIIVHYPHKYDYKRSKDEYEIAVAKKRNGRTGLITVKIIPEFYKLMNKI